MSYLAKVTCAALLATMVLIGSGNNSNAQDSVVITSVPVVIGHTAEPAGLFGLRTRYRPVVAPMVAPVAVAPAPVVVTPVYQSTTVRRVVVKKPTVIGPPRTVVYYTPPPVVHVPTVVVPQVIVPPVTYFIR